MILVTRFVAEAIAESACDDNIVIDNDDRIEIKVVLNALDIDEITAYVAHQHGNKKDAQDDLNYSFGKEDLASTNETTIYWAA